MNEIRSYGLRAHVRTEPSTFVLHYDRGHLVRSGRGLAFWIRPMTASVVQVPLDDRELDLVFHARSADFQDVTTQAVVTYRVVDPALVADRIDFALDLDTGQYLRAPLEQLSGLLSQLAQQRVWEYVVATPLRQLLVDGVDVVRTRVHAGLSAEPALTTLGIEIVAVRVSAIRPTSKVEQALQTPTREQLQQEADEATFQRRALAVEKERAIEENELQNRIELARREEDLVRQQGRNERLRVTEEAEDGRIAARGEADTIELVEGARVARERERMELYAELDPRVLLALAARDAAGALRSIDHLTISPDMIGPALSALAAGGPMRRTAGE